MIPFTKSQFSGGRKGVSYHLYTERRFFEIVMIFQTVMCRMTYGFSGKAGKNISQCLGLDFMGGWGGGGGGCDRVSNTILSRKTQLYSKKRRKNGWDARYIIDRKNDR